MLQLPPNLRADASTLESTLRQFPASVRVAVEPRHPSWWQPSIKGVLECHNAALCWADRRSRPVTPLWRTADWGYLRMHEGAARRTPRYGRQALSTWVHRLSETFDSKDVFVYFNNDAGGAAITDAVMFGEIADAAGQPVTRFPSPSTTAAPYVRSSGRR